MFRNNYWPIYERIEKEVIELSYNIRFDDNQSAIYSDAILDLILRISINIESLYQDIYRNETKKLKNSEGVAANIGTMINEINKTFLLTKKVLSPRHENFYFHKTFKEILPFSYKKNSKNDFYSAYNALKHNRSSNIEKANLNILLRSLAAFYILCVIYDDRWTPLKNDFYGAQAPLEFSYNTKIFSAKVYDRQLAYTEESISYLAMKIDSAISNKTSSIYEMFSQCEKNLHIKFRDQNPEECLFMSELTPEYLKSLDKFKRKYSKDAEAANVELGLIFGDYTDEKTFEKLGIHSLDVLMDHIQLNSEKNTIAIVVNRDNGSGVPSKIV